MLDMLDSVSRVPAADGRFPHVAGMQIEYVTTTDGIQGEQTLENASRIKSLSVELADGSDYFLVEDFTVVGDLTRTFVMATNSFLLTGGDGYVSLAAGNVLGETTLGEQDILENYISSVLDSSVSLLDPPPSPRVVGDPSGFTEAPVVAPTEEPVDDSSSAAVFSYVWKVAMALVLVF